MPDSNICSSVAPSSRVICLASAVNLAVALFDLAVLVFVAGMTIFWRHNPMNTQAKPLFPLGRALATRGALLAMKHIGIDPSVLLARHVSGDWGDLEDEDRQRNEEALVLGSRIFSAYRVGEVKFWVITEADRSVTTILLPEEY
jgi:hypothetical protein